MFWPMKGDKGHQSASHVAVSYKTKKQKVWPSQENATAPSIRRATRSGLSPGAPPHTRPSAGSWASARARRAPARSRCVASGPPAKLALAGLAVFFVVVFCGRSMDFWEVLQNCPVPCVFLFFSGLMDFVALCYVRPLAVFLQQVDAFLGSGRGSPQHESIRQCSKDRIKPNLKPSGRDPNQSISPTGWWLVSLSKAAVS